MDLTRYRKTRYQNIYQHIKNKNYIIDMSNPKTSITLIEGNRIFDIDAAKDIRDSKKIKLSKANELAHSGTFEVIWDKFMNHGEKVKKLAYNTLKKRKSFYKKIGPVFNTKKVSKITKNEVIDFLEKLETTNKQKNEILDCLKIFFNWCIYPGEYIIKSPIYKLPYYKVTKSEMKYWLPKHLKTWLNVVNKDIANTELSFVERKNAFMIKIFVLIQFNLGDRVGETRVIQFKNVSKEYNTIALSHSIEYNPNSKDYLGATKNYQSQRKIDVSQKLIEEIINYKKFLSNVGIKVSENDPIFYNYTRNFPYSDTYLREIFYYYIDKAKVPKIRLYDLRHTNVATLMSEGWELYHISQRLGHKNYSTTVDKYGHISSETRKEIAITTDKYY